MTLQSIAPLQAKGIKPAALQSTIHPQDAMAMSFRALQSSQHSPKPCRYCSLPAGTAGCLDTYFHISFSVYKVNSQTSRGFPAAPPNIFFTYDALLPEITALIPLPASVPVYMPTHSPLLISVFPPPCAQRRWTDVDQRRHHHPHICRTSGSRLLHAGSQKPLQPLSVPALSKAFL